jgi:glycosyltransferase involved in cell wall biosynthesis
MKVDYKIGIIAPTVSRAGNVFLGNLLDILTFTKDKVILISGSRVTIKKPNVKYFCLEHYGGGTFIIKILGYMWFEIKIVRAMMSSSKHVDIWIFFLGGESLLFPLIIGKLYNKKIYLLLAGSIEKDFLNKKDYTCIPLIITKKINLFFSDRIIVYSKGLVTQWHLEPYFNKICIAHRHFIDFDNFTINTPIFNRSPIIGYIGRLSEEKGVLNFIEALPYILNEKKDLRVIVVGDGPLMDSITRILQEKRISDRVDLLGWIAHDNLPQYLNQLQLLILPSNTEGLPNIILEAMACGTPVLATPVGAIPDIIKNRETGFIMNNNSPNCIASNVIGVLDSPDLEKISINGKQFVNDEFTFERIADKWKGIFEKL